MSPAYLSSCGKRLPYPVHRDRLRPRLRDAGVPAFEVANFKQHALSSGSEASAIAYIQIKQPDGKTRWGAGVEFASIKAVLSAVNRAK
jgi:2-isopropylmalate synthase